LALFFLKRELLPTRSRKTTIALNEAILFRLERQLRREIGKETVWVYGQKFGGRVIKNADRKADNNL